MNAPRFAIGDRVDARNDEGKWEHDAIIIGIEAHYEYRLAWPPDRRFRGGEIPGARWQEWPGVHAMRLSMVKADANGSNNDLPA
jgi:hypothetical protein